MNDAIKAILRIKDPSTMFDLMLFRAYICGQMGVKMPVDEGREVFKAIKKELSKVKKIKSR